MDGDKLLASVRQYATDELKEKIESEISELFSFCDAKIAKEQQANEAEAKKITEKYHAYIEKGDIKVAGMRIEADKIRKKIYESAVANMEEARTDSDYLTVSSEFEGLFGYEDSDELAKKMPIGV